MASINKYVQPFVWIDTERLAVFYELCDVDSFTILLDLPNDAVMSIEEPSSLAQRNTLLLTFGLQPFAKLGILI